VFRALSHRSARKQRVQPDSLTHDSPRACMARFLGHRIEPYADAVARGWNWDFRTNLCRASIQSLTWR